MKLIVFDLDNTLTEGNSWARLNIGLGMTKEEDSRLSGEYRRTQDSAKWIKGIMNIYNERGKPTKELVKDILSNFQYANGVKECIEKLKKEDYKIAIISGSPDIFTELICIDLGVDYFRSVYI